MIYLTGIYRKLLCYLFPVRGSVCVPGWMITMNINISVCLCELLQVQRKGWSPTAICKSGLCRCTGYQTCVSRCHGEVTPVAIINCCTSSRKGIRPEFKVNNKNSILRLYSNTCCCLVFCNTFIRKNGRVTIRKMYPVNPLNQMF